MARAADFDLAKELAKPSFTPSVRDAAALVALIVRGDEPAATRAAPALAGLGVAGRAAIEATLGTAPPATTTTPPATTTTPPATADDGAIARLISVLGLLARRGDDSAGAQVLAATRHASSRVRKAAAIALGKLGGEDARYALFARWDAGDAAPEERRALAEALGKVGGDEALVRLRALGQSDDGELMRRRDRAILMADRTAKRDVASAIASDVAPPAPIVIQLGCRPGLAALLGEELAALGIAARPIGDRGCEVGLAQPLGSLFAARLWATAAIPIALAPGADLAAAITQTILAPETLALLRAWTRGPIRWRLGFASGHKRAILWRVARDVTAAAPELINDPTATTWDIVVAEHEADRDAHRSLDEHSKKARANSAGEARMRRGASPAGSPNEARRASDAGAREPGSAKSPNEARPASDARARHESGPTATIALMPRRLDDPRFAYRVADVPAASHPTVAAALAWLGEAHAGDRVWDPFCGSGVELVERARRGPVRSLLGTDTDRGALQAARENLAAADVRAELAVGDARTHAPGPVDLILTNPPLGSRVQVDAAALLIAALPNFCRALASRGRLVWITPSPRKTGPAAEQLGLSCTRSYSVDLGGVRGQIERWDRR